MKCSEKEEKDVKDEVIKKKSKKRGRKPKGGKIINNTPNIIANNFKFEQNIVFDPKSELSYLYLSKIFKNLDKKKLQEHNLKTVILLNPKNEEATFNLVKLKLESSDYKKSESARSWRRPACPTLTPKHSPLAFQIVDIDMFDGKPLPSNPATDPATGLAKERPGMTQANCTVSSLLWSFSFF